MAPPLGVEDRIFPAEPSQTPWAMARPPALAYGSLPHARLQGLGTLPGAQVLCSHDHRSLFEPHFVWPLT